MSNTPPARLPLTAPVDRLLSDPHGHGFFQAVRLLERWLGQQLAVAPDQALRKLRFRNSLSLGFPASEIESLRALPARDGEGNAGGAAQRPDATALDHVEITPAFMGLLGGSGALPNFYTELFAQRESQHKDPAARAFLDIFQQRAATLLYQAWRKQRLALRYEQDRRKHFTPLLLSLAGLGQQALRRELRDDKGGLSDDSLAHFAGRLQQRPVSAATLQQVLQSYFGVPVEVEQFVGRWYSLGPAQQTQLGMQSCGLGLNALVGERVWQRDQRVRLTLGPLTRAQLQHFLPGHAGAATLQHWLRELTGLRLEYDVRLRLRADAVGPAVLGAPTGLQLGYDCFLVTQARNHDRFEPGYAVMAA